MIKFTRTYSKEVHNWFYAREQAPQYEMHVLGGWIMVIMEKLDFISWDNMSTEQRTLILPQLREAIHRLHEAGLVHGDLRPPNVGSMRGKLIILDYDWAGPIGQATYPVVPNPQAGFHPSASIGSLIQPDHDHHLVSRLIDE
eukprot:gnl/Trimastix_PCT/315.p3 GENE.gnl/Trimastix_PCT/315~~gnl/Trimastix_PCT/315.p3  ORF type:complete len:142 (+),score=23.13 gnl/Trimastix_PCT/315:969-1394(+)